MAYLTYLAAERRVSRSTQMQALSAIQLLYREVLDRPVSDLRRVLRSTSPTRLPAVLSRDEVRTVLVGLEGPVHLIALLLYGAGLRPLRVKDLSRAENSGCGLFRRRIGDSAACLAGYLAGAVRCCAG